MWSKTQIMHLYGKKIMVRVMCPGAAGLGAVILISLVEMSVFGYGYAAISHAFPIFYLINLFRD